MNDIWNDIENLMEQIFFCDKEITERKIEGALRVLANQYNVENDSEGFDRTFRNLRAKLMPKISQGITLMDTTSAWKAWLPELQNLDSWKASRSNSYYEYLLKDKNSDYASLEYTTNEIVGMLSDPRKAQPPVSRKGLVLGDVQSGKTRSYIALMNLATDCGYKLLIVLTSDNEDLRQQTQKRIDTDYVGFRGNSIPTGIGKYQKNKGIAHPIQLTNENDFVTPSANAFHTLARPSWNNVPYVAVLKKNASTLSKFNKWLDSPEFSKDLPVLIIDDESDYASVNSSKSDDSPTRINQLLRDLCELSKRTSYVAVTATPFANIFIDDTIEKDLFPKDFIHILQSPSIYIGVKELFGDMDGCPENNMRVHELDEDELEDWLPLGHKKTYEIFDPSLDPQVQYAINCFVIACCLRPNSQDKQQSMLIHMSRFTEVQRQIADRVYHYLRDIVNAARFHCEDAEDPYIESLRNAFENEYQKYDPTNGLTWEEMLSKIHQFALSGRLRVRLVNSDSLEWNSNHGASGPLASNECTIFVGGNQLSRGMTLEGLICSVFYRRVTASDTLLQMGRWFGYRPNYENLQRIWMLPQSVMDYRYSCTIVEELKDSARKMKEQGMTPKEFGLAIRKNPNTGVRITNPGKMRNATEDSTYQEFDLAGEIIESVRLGIEPTRLHSNNAALTQLVKDCQTSAIPSLSKKANTQVFQNVPSSSVVEFLSQYRSGYGDKPFGLALMTYKDRSTELDTSLVERYAKTQQENYPDLTWNVAFINGVGKENVRDTHPELGLTFDWYPVERTSSCIKIKEANRLVYQVNGSKMRLGSKTDVLKVAAATYSGDIPKQNGSERDSYLTKYFGDTPSLLLYMVTLKDKDGKETHATDLNDANSIGVIAAKLIVPKDEANSTRHHGYTVFKNSVAVRNDFERLENEVASAGDEED